MAGTMEQHDDIKPVFLDPTDDYLTNLDTEFGDIGVNCGMETDIVSNMQMAAAQRNGCYEF